MSNLILAATATLSLLAAAAGPATALSQTPPASAVSAESLALAERLIAAVQGANLDKQMNQMLLDIFQEEVADETHRAWMNAQARPMAMAMMRNMMRDLVTVYAEVFTVDELNAQIAFYESPVGRAIADKTVALAGREEAVAVVHQQAFMTELMTKFCAEFDCTGGGVAGEAKTRR